MRLYYPKSFFKLVIVGVCLVALPMLFVLASVAISVDRLSDQSRRAVYQAARATQASRRLGELVDALERNARQFLILRDSAILDNYQANRERLLTTAQAFSSLPLGGQQQTQLAELLARERAVFETLSSAALKPAQIKQAAADFVEIADLAQSIAATSNELIDHEVSALEKTATNARDIMFWQLMALVPVLIFLVVGFTVLVARPIRQIDTAIRRLGDGEFGLEIVVNGPEDLQYLGRQLDWMRRRLIELEEQKNKFLRHVSHELKTPLTVLREGAEVLAEGMVGKLTAEQLEIAQILRHNSVELQRLIEDLLNYGALQFHKASLIISAVDMRALVERVIGDQKIALQAKRLEVAVEGDEAQVSGDAEKLRIVVDNLLSNAVKFSPPGGIITVRMQSMQQNLVVDVLDAGPGIASSEAERVFDAFYRGSAAQGSRVKGTGLGLSIVKEYVAAHHGVVEVIDTTGHGGHLRVSLPLAAEHVEE
jgi:two-component system sensor histidine kinase GlrK